MREDRQVHEEQERNFQIRAGLVFLAAIGFFYVFLIAGLLGTESSRQKARQEEIRNHRTASTMNKAKADADRIMKEGVAIKHLVDKTQFFEQCSPSKRPVCVILFLPSLTVCDRFCRYDILLDLDELVANHSRKSVKTGWLWTEIGQQPNLEKALGIELIPDRVTTVYAKQWTRFWTYEEELLSASIDSEDRMEFVNSCFRGETGSGFIFQHEGLPKILSVPRWEG